MHIYQEIWLFGLALIWVAMIGIILFALAQHKSAKAFPSQNLGQVLRVAYANMEVGEVASFSSGANQKIMQFYKYCDEDGSIGLDWILPIGFETSPDLTDRLEKFITAKGLSHKTVKIPNNQMVVFVGLGKLELEITEWLADMLQEFFGISNNCLMAIDDRDLIIPSKHYRWQRNRTQTVFDSFPTRYGSRYLFESGNGLMSLQKVARIQTIEDYSL